MSLDELGLIYKTDKSSNGHNYLHYYEMFLKPIKYAKINLLEIGIDEGSSLRMWHEYFSMSDNIHGIDIRGNYEYLEEHSEIKTHIVDQSNKQQLSEFGQKYNDFFNVIVCDGSHVAEDDILTFNTLFPYLKSGGFFIVEDNLCSLDKERWGKNANFLDRVKQMVDEVNMNGKIPNSHICANKHEAVKKYDANYYEKHIEWIFVGCGFVIVKKM